MSKPEQPILFFDGACQLCAGLVRFAIKRDRRGRLQFAALQSALAQERVGRFGRDPLDLDTAILIEGEAMHLRSAAILRALELLGGPWSGLAVLRRLPRGLRDWLYMRVAWARNRLWKRDPEAAQRTREQFPERFADELPPRT